jgi:histidinol phosphatase-like PHP family hydrolase
MPAPAAPSTSLASAALAAEVAKKVREKGLVLWLDSDGQYSGLVDRNRCTAPIFSGAPPCGSPGLEITQAGS